MRVSDNTNYGVVRDSIQRSKSRMENLQTQNATLKKVNKPSDDPIGSAKILEVRTDKVNNEQFLSNSKLAENYLNNTDHAMDDLSEIVMRAKEIAINQASGASSTQDTRMAVAEEIKQLYERAIATGNRRIGDRYIFGGYKTMQTPVDIEGQFHGDQGEMMAEIGREVFIAMNLPGVEVFNTQPNFSSDMKRIEEKQMKPEDAVSRRLATASNADGNGEESQELGTTPNVNLFQELKALRIGLLTGDLNGIRGSLERFDELQGRILANRAKIGSRINGIQGAASAMERHNITNAQLSSALEDADMTQVVSDLAKEETQIIFLRKPCEL